MKQTNKRKALLLENIHPAAKLMLEKAGFAVETANTSPAATQLAEKIPTIEVLGIRSKTRINRQIIKAAKKLKFLAAYCVGTDQIDIPACRKHSIQVINDPFSNTRSVAELVIGEIIVLSRKILEKNYQLHQGRWDKAARGCHEIYNKTLGIIGYGRIGSQLGLMAEGLGMRVIFFDREEKLTYGRAEKYKSIEKLLKNSDIISVHVDGRSENKQLIGKWEFLLMKNNAIFINASRGFVVNLEALTECLIQGKIAGAAIDVFPNEPKNVQDIFISPLQKFPNVILTPHIGGNTIEAQEKIARRVTQKIIDCL